jgi:predicted nucleotidyltransferase
MLQNPILERRLGISRTTLAEFCHCWHITELALFGSVLRDDFSPESDIDLLVSFDPTFRRGLTETIEIQSQLQQLLGRDVDLIIRKALERSENIPRRDRIINSAQVIYNEPSIMNRQEIISEIKRISEELGGKAPGFQLFATKTGLRKSEWYPDLWLRWGDAIIEADCQPNDFQTAYEKDFLIVKYIDLIRELGHFPLEGELRIKNKTDKTFPSHSGFASLGSKKNRILAIYEYCQERDGLEDIIAHCTRIKLPAENLETFSANVNSVKVGYVYLLKHGARNEYKIGRTNNPIRREGEIRLELPEKIQPVHYIETDDPSGIERYWHHRFSSKRKEGEWFSLTADDVRAFKRWRKIY